MTTQILLRIISPLKTPFGVLRIPFRRAKMDDNLVKKAGVQRSGRAKTGEWISSVLGIHLTQLITKRKSRGAGALARGRPPLAGLLGGRRRASAPAQGARPTSAPDKSWLSQMDTQ